MTNLKTQTYGMTSRKTVYIDSQTRITVMNYSQGIDVAIHNIPLDALKEIVKKNPKLELKTLHEKIMNKTFYYVEITSDLTLYSSEQNEST